MNDLEKLRDFVWKFQSHYGSYHNHKENMAHLAMATQVIFTIAVVTWDKWPPKFENVEGILLRIGIFGLWLALYLYTGFEMRLRQWSAIMGVAIEKCASKLNSIESLQDYNTSEENQDNLPNWYYRIYKQLFWFPWSYSYFDIKPEERRYPNQLSHEINARKNSGDKRLLIFETIFFITSVLCGLAILFKIL